MGAQRRLADMPPITGGTSMTAAAVIQLHPKDSVVIARASLVPGIPVAEGVATAERIPSGHKVAVLPVAPGEPVRRAESVGPYSAWPLPGARRGGCDGVVAMRQGVHVFHRGGVRPLRRAHHVLGERECWRVRQ